MSGTAAAGRVRPSAGLGAVMFMLGVGLMVGPGIAGVVAARLGFPAAFVGAAALVACVGLLFPREDLRVAPAGPVRLADTSRP